MSSASVSALGSETITHGELVRALRRHRVVLVDVLAPESFAAMHIPGAINLPVDDITRRAPELLPDRRADIVAYCGGPTGPLGDQAGRLLGGAGDTLVPHLTGGGLGSGADAVQPLLRLYTPAKPPTTTPAG